MNHINTNRPADTAARHLTGGPELLGRSLSRLSSGSRPVSGRGDAAGLAVSDRFDAQRLRIRAAATDIQNAISSVQVANSSLAAITEALARMGELAADARQVQGGAELAPLRQEFRALQEQLRATIGGGVDEGGGQHGVPAALGALNGKALFSPAFDTTSDVASPQNVHFPAASIRAGAISELVRQEGGGRYRLDVGAGDAADTVAGAAAQVATQRAGLEAKQSELELAAATFAVESQNLSAAVSRIQTSDTAEASTSQARDSIASRPGTAMLAQANQAPQSVLKLL